MCFAISIIMLMMSLLKLWTSFMALAVSHTEFECDKNNTYITLLGIYGKFHIFVYSLVGIGFFVSERFRFLKRIWTLLEIPVLMLSLTLYFALGLIYFYNITEQCTHQPINTIGLYLLAFDGLANGWICLMTFC